MFISHHMQLSFHSHMMPSLLSIMIIPILAIPIMITSTSTIYHHYILYIYWTCIGSFFLYKLSSQHFHPLLSSSAHASLSMPHSLNFPFYLNSHFPLFSFFALSLSLSLFINNIIFFFCYLYLHKKMIWKQQIFLKKVI